MPGTHQQLRRLVDLAKEPSSEKRRELLREVTDLFLEKPGAHSEDEATHFGEIIGRVASEMDTAVRKHLSERLAGVPQAPRGLIAQLANDAIEVAKPVLMKNLALTDTDLVAIAKLHGQEHLKALSARPLLSASVADEIVARGDDTVLETLAKNSGATLSRTALETLVTRAESNERLHVPVAKRKDLPPDLMNEMVLFVSSSLRKYVLERVAQADEKEIEAGLEFAKARAARRAKQMPEYTSSEKFIAQKIRDKQLNEHLLLQLLKGHQGSDFLVGLAHIAEVDVTTAKRIVSDPSCEALAIVARACRFDRSTFSTFALLLGGSKTRSAGEVTDLLSLYDQIPVEIAQRTLRFWKVRKQAERHDAVPQQATA
jgi:uncharacterized protein (DUF2336 family)